MKNGRHTLSKHFESKKKKKRATKKALKLMVSGESNKVRKNLQGLSPGHVKSHRKLVKQPSQIENQASTKGKFILLVLTQPQKHQIIKKYKSM